MNANDCSSPPGCAAVSPDGLLLQVDATIDSALQAALRDARERVALLRLEAVLCDFVKSDAVWMEVCGQANAVILSPAAPTLNRMSAIGGRQTSFQRCILHRLADRFGIQRENGVLAEGAIRLIKTPLSAIPTRLLQDLDPSEYAEVGTLGISSITATLAKHQLGDKPMRIMKRSDKCKGSSTPDTSKPSHQRQSSLTGKEKAYAEARARIFSDENMGAAVSIDLDGETSSPPAPSTTTSQHSLIRTLTPSSRTQSSDSINASSNNLNVSVNSSAAALESKAVYRNRLEEASDPDFRRGVGTFVFAPPVMHQSVFYGGEAPAYYAMTPPPPPSPLPYTSSTAHLARSPYININNNTEGILTATAPVFVPSRPRVYSDDGLQLSQPSTWSKMDPKGVP